MMLLQTFTSLATTVVPPNLIPLIMGMMPANVRAWVEFAIEVIGAASFVTGVLPARYATNPVLRFIRLIAATTHADQYGSIKVPGTNIVIAFGTPAPAPTPAPPAAS